jgi:hypothetical protein
MGGEYTSEDVPVVYQVPGTTLLVGVNRRGSVLLGEPTLSVDEPVKWEHGLRRPETVSALQQILEAAMVDSRGITLDRLAAEYVTDEMVAAATAALEASDEDSPRGRMIDMLGATPLLSSFTADQALTAFRWAKPGGDVRAALVAVARSRIADGSIKP